MNSQILQQMIVSSALVVSMSGVQAYNFSGVNNYNSLNNNLSDLVINPSVNSNIFNFNSNCVTFPRLKVGQKVKYKNKTFNNGAITNVTISEQEIVSSSTTSLAKRLVDQGDVQSTIYITDYFSIANNYKNTTRVKINLSLNGNFIETFNSYFSPYSRDAIDRVCKNQTWTSTYDVQTGYDAISVSKISVINSVNLFKYVGAGFFRTFKKRTEDGYGVTTTWTDINSGVLVFSERRNNLGEITSSEELIYKNTL